MRLILYGTNTDNRGFEEKILAVPELCYRNICIETYSDHDSFIAGLGGSPPDVVVVTMDSADGMEGVIAAKAVCPDAPILWFSDDGGFGVQSYRLGCAYFHEKPVSPEIVSTAIAKCM